MQKKREAKKKVLKVHVVRANHKALDLSYKFAFSFLKPSFLMVSMDNRQVLLSTSTLRSASFVCVWVGGWFGKVDGLFLYSMSEFLQKSLPRPFSSQEA